jgi:colicin import membrane protein
LQPLQNNKLYNIPSEKGKGIAGTIIIHAVALGVLLLFGFTVPVMPPPELGIEVNFGTDDTGSGLIEPSESSSSVDAAPPLPAQAVNESQDEALLTQDTEEAPEVKKVDPEAARKKQEELDAEKRRLEEIEAERVRKVEEEKERKRVEAEKQRQSDISNRTINALINTRNTGSTSTGEGITVGAGNQGVVTGSVESQNRGDGGGTGNKGIVYELQGRGVQKLPNPVYDYQEDGKVVVEVIVDRSGTVTQAIPGIKGSTTLNPYLLKAAKVAALQARFDAKPDALPEKGSITYIFKLN